MIRQYLASNYSSSAPNIRSYAGFSNEKIIKDKYDFRTLKHKQLLYILARRDPFGQRITKSKAALALARGFKIIPQSEKSYKVIKDFLFKLHRADPITALLDRTRELAEDAIWSGWGFWERIYDAPWNSSTSVNGKFIGIRKLHPLNMDLKRDLSGNVLFDDAGSYGPPGEFLSYTWHTEDFQKSRDIDKRRVACLKFNTYGDEQIGISELEPIFKTRQRGMSIEDGIAQGAFRHGVPFLDVTVGDDQHPPDKDMTENVKEEVSNSSYMSEFVHPPWIKTQMFEQFSLARSRGMLDPYIELIATSTGIPRSVMTGSGEGTNKATVRELVNLLQPIVIMPMQIKIKLFLEEQIFAPLIEQEGIDEVPLVQLNELFPSDYSLADKLKVMSETFIDSRPLITWQEAREIAKLPSDEPGTLYSLSRQDLSAGKESFVIDVRHGSFIKK